MQSNATYKTNGSSNQRCKYKGNHPLFWKPVTGAQRRFGRLFQANVFRKLSTSLRSVGWSGRDWAFSVETNCWEGFIAGKFSLGFCSGRRKIKAGLGSIGRSCRHTATYSRPGTCHTPLALSPDFPKSRFSQRVVVCHELLRYKRGRQWRRAVPCHQSGPLAGQ